MSVLQSLKGTFQTVQQDIVDGFRALGALDSTTRQRKLLDLEIEGIRVDAGADLLHRYHENWSEMAQYSAQSAHTAQEVGERVRGLFGVWERWGQSANQLAEEAAILPTITSTLRDMLEVIESLCEDFQAVEEELERLEDVREEEGVRRERLNHRCQLAAYRKTRQADSVAVKRRLWKRLAEQWKEVERGRKGRGHSVVAEMDHLSHPPSSLHLLKAVERVDQSHIDQEDVMSSDEGEHPDLSSHEGTFIEDDYILDYSSTGDHHHLHDDLFPELDSDGPVHFDEPPDRSGVAGPDVRASEGGETDGDGATGNSPPHTGQH